MEYAAHIPVPRHPAHHAVREQQLLFAIFQASALYSTVKNAVSPATEEVAKAAMFATL